jgi:membrane associated rhomboid family serine protease
MKDFIDKNPWTGVWFATISGLGGSVMSAIDAISSSVGLIAAVFGLMAGVYTFKIQKEKHRRLFRQPPPR